MRVRIIQLFSQNYHGYTWMSYTQTCRNDSVHCSLVASAAICLSSSRGDRLTPSGLGDGVTAGRALFLTGLPPADGGVVEWEWLLRRFSGMDSSGENRSCFVGVVSNLGDLLVGVASHDDAFLFLLIGVESVLFGFRGDGVFFFRGE